MTDTPILPEGDATPEEIPEPQTVEVGQMWRDNDQRTKGSGEFTVVAVVGSRHGDATYLPGHPRPDLVSKAVKRTVLSPAIKDSAFPFAIVNRDGRLTRVNCDRLLKGTNTQRGYTYLGMSR